MADSSGRAPGPRTQLRPCTQVVMGMTRQIPRFLAGAAACAALCAPAPATAGDVLSVKGDRVERVNDPFVPGPGSSGLGPAPQPARARSAPPPRAAASRPTHGPVTAHAAATKRRKKKRAGPTRGEKAVSRALRSALGGRRISRRTFKGYGRLLTRARVAHKRLRGARRREPGGTTSSTPSRGACSSPTPSCRR